MKQIVNWVYDYELECNRYYLDTHHDNNALSREEITEEEYFNFKNNER